MTRRDIDHIVHCYENNWPQSERGPVLDYDVRSWIKRYQNRESYYIEGIGNVPADKGLIGEVGGEPVSFITYSRMFFVAKIYEVVVPLSLQGLGHGLATARALQEKLRAEGVVVAEFDATPGAIANRVLRGDFEKMGEGIGADTGLPTVIGQVTAETNV